MVMCLNPKDGCYYEARIVHVKRSPNSAPVYTLHYKVIFNFQFVNLFVQGWGKKYDEQIVEGELEKRFMEHTQENVETNKAKDEFSS